MTKLDLELRKALGVWADSFTVEAFLLARGWECVDTHKWRHPKLAYIWPEADALRLEEEEEEPLSKRQWP
jgi:hypothetical protein